MRGSTISATPLADSASDKARNAFMKACKLGPDPTLLSKVSGIPVGLKVCSSDALSRVLTPRFPSQNLGATCYANAFLQVCVAPMTRLRTAHRLCVSGLVSRRAVPCWRISLSAGGDARYRDRGQDLPGCIIQMDLRKVSRNLPSSSCRPPSPLCKRAKRSLLILSS